MTHEDAPRGVEQERGGESPAEKKRWTLRGLLTKAAALFSGNREAAQQVRELGGEVPADIVEHLDGEDAEPVDPVEQQIELAVRAILDDLASINDLEVSYPDHAQVTISACLSDAADALELGVDYDDIDANVTDTPSEPESTGWGTDVTLGEVSVYGHPVQYRYESRNRDYPGGEYDDPQDYTFIRAEDLKPAIEHGLAQIIAQSEQEQPEGAPPTEEPPDSDETQAV